MVQRKTIPGLQNFAESISDNDLLVVRRVGEQTDRKLKASVLRQYVLEGVSLPGEVFLEQGDNITITGSGTEADPYVINATGGGTPGEDGADGADGKSAYQIALDNGFVGSQSAWLASLNGSPGANGDDGNDGADGKSAYQIALDNGFVGSQSAWLASLNGSPGANGEDGDDGTDGTDGKSAYQIALDNGFVGSQSAWLASLKGNPGDPGEPGAPGADGADGEDGSDATVNAANVAAAGAVMSVPTGIAGATAVTNLLIISQADYDELSTEVQEAHTFLIPVEA